MRAQQRANRVLFLLVVIAGAPPHPTCATLTFNKPTDILGIANLFEEGDSGLPTRSFTYCCTVRSSSGTDRVILQRMGLQFYLHFYPATSGLLDVTLDTTSYLFDPSTKFSTEDAIMAMRTWCVAYQDADNTTGLLSLHIDATHIETMTIAAIFPNRPIFGPDAIPSLVTGPYAFVANDDEGNVVLTTFNNVEGLNGQLDAMQLWDRALNASDVAELAANPSNLTGDESGLAICLRADRGHGSRIRNLGYAGASYDGILGQYASGPPGQTSAVYGVGCDALSTSSPVWVNRSGGVNTPPTANDAVTEVKRGSGTISGARVVWCDWIRNFNTLRCALGDRIDQRCASIRDNIFCRLGRRR